MLSPEYLLHVSEGAEQIASQLHTAVLKQIIIRIKAREKNGYGYLLTSRDKWAIQNMVDSGYLAEDIQKEIAKYSRYMETEIRDAMLEAGTKAIAYDDSIYKAVGLDPQPLRQSPFLMRLMERDYEKTVGTWRNYTGTFADAAQGSFIEKMDEIYNLVSTGNVGYIQAYYDAIDSLADQGITMITYTNPSTGREHRDTVETAALRCVRTGTAQMSAEIGLKRMEEMGCDLVLTSSHMGARPSHQEWQGRVFSLSGKTRKYPDFVSSTEYGTVGGLAGVNCRHSVSPYFEGMDNPFKHYDDKKNKELYEKTQEQRGIERGIRKEKRAIEALNTALNNTVDPDDIKRLEENISIRKAELREKNKLYKEFCDKNNLRPLQERLRIAQAGRQRPEEKYNDDANY